MNRHHRYDRLERSLGRSLPPSEECNISHLNGVPPELLRESRSLGGIALARDLLTYCTTMECHRFLDVFIQDVVFGGAPAETWRRGRILVPDFSLEEQLCHDPESLIAPLGGTPAHRIAPSRSDWSKALPWVGSPARPEPDADYRSKLPEQTVGLATQEIEDITDIVTTVRRWIAARLASVLEHRGQLTMLGETPGMPEGLPPVRQWTPDARVAWRALSRERRELERSDQEIPGFAGPDEWYRVT